MAAKLVQPRHNLALALALALAPALQTVACGQSLLACVSCHILRLL